MNNDMKKICLLLIAFCIPAGCICAEQVGKAAPAVKKSIPKRKPARWNIISRGEGGTYQLTQTSTEAFSLVLHRNGKDKPARTMLCLDLNREFHTQNRLFFTCRSINGKPVMVHPLLSYRSGKKSILKFGPKLMISGKAEKMFALRLDTDFKLGDATFPFLQLKFSADISGAKEGETVELDVSGMRICMPEEAGMSSERPEVLVIPGRKAENIKRVENPVKVFFMFDNEDFSTVFCGRGNYPRVQDRCQFPGYRSLLLKTVKDQTELAASPESADMIVYAGARADKPMAERVAKAVRNGKPLYVAAVVADPEIAELLPVSLKKRDGGLPVRRTLKAVSAADPLFAGLSSASFGQYFDVRMKAGGKARLVFADGSPAMAEGVAGKGRVIWSALGIGTDLIPGKASEDPLLLRVISEQTGKALRETERKPVPRAGGWQEGLSTENFGRFGWLIGDGLLVESMNDVFDVSNGSAQYAFKSRLAPKLSLTHWSFKPLNAGEVKAKQVDWSYCYAETGKFEYNTTCVIPAAWKEEKISFTVEGGIDDLAEVFVNGRSVGRVTEDMPEYWRRPHRYLLPKELLKFGEENRIRIVAENLRGNGSMGSCPELICLPSKAERWTFAADRANELGKGGVITDSMGKRRFDTSLAFPGIRWEIFGNRIVMGLFNIAGYAAIPSGKNWKIVDLTKAETLPVNWSAPWILLFHNGECRPLLLVFSKRQEKITVSKVGSAVNGLVFERGGGIGMIVPLWLGGGRNVDTAPWTRGLPAEIAEQAEFWGRKAFAYPVAETEMFRINRKSGRVEIRTKYQFLRTENDWNVSVASYAPVPPLAFFTKGRLFESEQARDWELMTNYGSYAAHDNSDTVEWSLPLPEPDFSLLPRIEAEPEVHRFANAIFRKGAPFNAGGGVRELSWSPAYPTGPNFPDCRNVNAHGWLHGINQVMIAPFALDAEARARFMERVRRKAMEPAELYRYKSALRWREEPFSGIRYPIYFNNRHPHSIKFAEGFGSAINYADANETAHMILAVSQMLADRHGQRDFIRANGSWLRSAARLLLVSDDWAYMASHCRESGLSATIDMLNCEYASMMKLARLAEILGDDELRDQALYRGARRLVPTVARLPFLDYARKNGLLYLDNAMLCVGFHEQGFHYRSKGTKASEVDLYDMSQGIPPDIVPLYRKYCPEEERAYFEKLVLPGLYDKTGAFAYKNPALLAIIAHASAIRDAELRRALFKCMEKVAKTSSFTSDWPGITVASQFAPVLYRLYGKVRIRTAKDLDIRDFSYDPAAKLLCLDFRAGAVPELVLESTLNPADSVYRRDADGLIRIPLHPGEEKKLELRFR